MIDWILLCDAEGSRSIWQLWSCFVISRCQMKMKI